MLGEEQKKMSKVAIGDADSLIALAYQNDANHKRAEKVSEWLQANNYEVIYRFSVLELLSLYSFC